MAFDFFILLLEYPTERAEGQELFCPRMSFLLQNKGQLTIEVTYSGLILLSALRFPNAKPPG
jgi:hypothetical protein